MPGRVSANVYALERLRRIKTVKKRKEALVCANQELIACLVEAIHNILQGLVPLNNNEYKKLKKHAHILRRLSRERETAKARQLLVQKGNGFLPILLPLLVSLAGHFLG